MATYQKSNVTHKGLKYNLDNYHSLAVEAALNNPELDHWYPNGVGALTDSTTAMTAGKIYTLVDANGGANSLPVLGVGERIKVLVKGASGSTVYTCGSGQTLHTSSYATLTDIADGNAAFAATATAGDNTVTLNGTTTGGLGGDEITFIGVSSSKIMVVGRLNGSGTLASPFSTV